MRSPLVVLVCALAACEAEGVELIVDTSATPDVTEVRLYVGTGAAMTEMLAPAGFAPADRLRGRTWELDAPHLERIQQVGTGQPARFQVMSRTPDETISVIAVGFDASGPVATAAAFDLAFPPGVVARWELRLEAATPASAAGTGNEVQVWGKKPGDRTCVHAGFAAELAPNVRRAFFVDAGDRDCDSFTSPEDECNDAWHLATSGPAPRALRCLDLRRLVSASNPGVTLEACLVGGPGCRDGEGTTGSACTYENRFCAPRALCSRCTDVAGAESQFGCAFKPTTYLGGAPIPPHARCPLRYDPNTMRLCTRNMTVQPVQGTALLPCPQEVLFQGQMGGWDTTGTVGGAAMQFGFDMGSGDCPLTIATTSSGPPATVDPQLFPYFGLVAVRLVGGQGVVVPIKFELDADPGCASETDVDCDLQQYNPDLDTVDDCVLGSWQPAP